MERVIVCIFCCFLAAQAYGAPIVVDMTPIAGKNLNDLYGKYMSRTGPAPRSATIDFERNLEVLWDQKTRHPKATESTRAHGPRVLAYYKKNKTKMTVREFVSSADREVAFAKKHIDWKGLCAAKKLDVGRCTLLRRVVASFVGKDLVAYGLTELMPSAEGRFNVRYLDILLRHAGAEYVQSLPALYDGMLSLGLYQLTSHAVRDDGKVTEGASLISRYVGAPAKIPGSVAALRGGEHHRAAFYFAIHNIARLIARCSARELTVFSQKYDDRQDEFVQYVATAHHLPEPALQGARRWLASGMKGEYRRSLGPKLHRYAVKTQTNLVALYEVIK